MHGGSPGKKTILPVFVRRVAGQVVVTAVKEKSAQEKVMLQRLRSVRYIASRSACIRKGLPDITPGVAPFSSGLDTSSMVWRI